MPIRVSDLPEAFLADTADIMLLVETPIISSSTKRISVGDFLNSFVAQPNGIAPLDASGIVPAIHLPPASVAAIEIRDEGTPITTTTSSIDIVGPGVQATNVGPDVTFTFAQNLNDIAAPVSPFSMASQPLTDLPLPVASGDATNKEYVDSLSAGLDPKGSCRIKTTGSLGFSGAVFNPLGGVSGTGLFTNVDLTDPNLFDDLETSPTDATPIVLGVGDRVLVDFEFQSWQQEETEIVCDTFANMVSEGYFWIFNGVAASDAYYFWIKKTALDTEPFIPTGNRPSHISAADLSDVNAVEVDIQGAVTADDVGTIIANVIQSTSTITTSATNVSGTVTFEHSNVIGDAIDSYDDPNAPSGVVSVTVLQQGTLGAPEHGIYEVVIAGAAGALQRAPDHDGTPSSEVSGGNYTFIEAGKTCAGSGWVLIADGEINLNTDPINFTQISSANSYFPGLGININGQQIQTDLIDTEFGSLGYFAGAIRVELNPSGHLAHSSSGLEVQAQTIPLNFLADTNGVSGNDTNDYIIYDDGPEEWFSVTPNLSRIHRVYVDSLGFDYEQESYNPEYNFLFPTTNIYFALPNDNDTDEPEFADFFFIENTNPDNFKIDVVDESGGTVLQELSTAAGVTQVAYIWDGNGWRKTYDNTLTRRFIKGNLTYFVRSTGNDSNDGLTVGSAFLTIQRAIEVIAGSLDLAAFITVTIDVGAGTFGGFVTQNIVGQGIVSIQGAGVGLTTINNTCFFNHTGKYCIGNVTFAPGANRAIESTNGVIELNNPVDFQSALVHIFLFGNNAKFIVATNYTISGGALFHIETQLGGQVSMDPSFLWNVTLTGTPNFSIAFIRATITGFIDSGSSKLTYTGAATGVRYTADANGVINVPGSGVNYFPGNAAGTLFSGGQYIA